MTQSVIRPLKTTGRPVYMQEPMATRDTFFPYPSNDRAEYFLQAIANVKLSGAAAWCFHTEVAVDFRDGPRFLEDRLRAYPEPEWAFVTSLNAAAPDYTQSLISAVDGVLVVIILIDIMRTVLTHLEGWGFPFRPFLVIGIIAAVRDILAVSTRLTLSSGTATKGATPIPQSLVELGTNAGVILVLAVALFLTRGQDVDAETDTRQ